MALHWRRGLLMSTAIWLAGVDPARPLAAASGQLAGVRIVALLGGGRIVVLNAEDGSQLADRMIAAAPWTAGLSLGMAPTKDTIFAALVDSSRKKTAAVAISLKDFTATRVAEIADSIVYRWLVVGPRTGRLFFASEEGVRVVMFDPRTKSLVRYSPSRDPGLFRWVWWLAMSPKEDRLYFSYHGDATGVDWLDVKGSTFVACNESISRSPIDGCASAHGRVVPYGTGMAVAAGPHVLLLNTHGGQIHAFDTGLDPYNHFMEFAVDTANRAAYAIGPCAYAGGLTRIPLTLSSPVDESGTLLNPSVCGERIVLSDDGRFLAVASGDKLTLVESRTGAVLRTIVLSAPVVDVLFAGS